MKRKILALVLSAAMLFTACGGSDSSSTNQNGAALNGEGHGYGGTLKVAVTMDGDTIQDIELVDHHESEVVIERAFPVLKERILAEQTPIVDSVSGATVSSYAIKVAVAQALEGQGKDYGTITMVTKSENPSTEKVADAQTQLLVVGGGPSGLAAAITAKQHGVENVLLIEKLDILSGNGKFDLNFYDVFNSKAQIANGVEDSIEKFIEDKKSAGETPERLNVWAQSTSTLDEWLRNMGVSLDYNYGGRNHMATEDDYAGAEIQRGLEKTAKELGVEIRTGTKGVDLILDGDVVTGVVAEHSGQQYNITADAVILATGGFSNNKELLAKYAPGHEVLNTSNQLGATGDFVPLFEKYGFKLENMDTIRVIPIITIPGRDLSNSGKGSIFVNKNGERFINERLGGLEMGEAILEQGAGSVWMVVDAQKVIDHANVRKQVKLGKFVEAESLEALAEKIGVNAENLVATVEAYNEHAKNGTTDEFGQVPERELLSNGSYYAIKVESGVHMTKGGVATNEYGQVLKTNDKPVEGLYASGEVTWQSGGYAQSVVFGRIAAENAAKFVQSK